MHVNPVGEMSSGRLDVRAGLLNATLAEIFFAARITQD